MDEPTASLNDVQVAKLFSIIRRLKSEGKTIIYVSHRLKEVFEITDCITVLKDGKFVECMVTAKIDETRLLRSMAGRDASSFYSRKAVYAQDDIVMLIEDLSKRMLYDDISFSLHRCEILSIGGLMGCNREEILKTIFGIIQPDKGKIFFEGQEITITNPKQAIKQKIVFVTENRNEEGIFQLMSVKENLSISIIDQIYKFFKFIINTTKEQEICEYYRDDINIHYADESQRINSVSGGNQQKILLARALATNCQIMLLLEPTRGIDVGAKSEIYKLFQKLAQEGISIIMVSSEMGELVSISDRVLIIHQGRITGNLEKKDITEDNIMFCATGTKQIFSEKCRV